MPIEQQAPMSRTSITIVVLVLLCAAGFAYSQGWFDWSNSSYETGSNEVGNQQRIDQENVNDDAAPLTQPAKEPVTPPTE